MAYVRSEVEIANTLGKARTGQFLRGNGAVLNSIIRLNHVCKLETTILIKKARVLPDNNWLSYVDISMNILETFFIHIRVRSQFVKSNQSRTCSIRQETSRILYCKIDLICYQIKRLTITIIQNALLHYSRVVVNCYRE